MPVIKPRTTQRQLVRHITRLYRENNETLFAYAKFLGEPTEYVINQLVENVLAKDKDFVTWREENPGSHVPRPGERKPKSRARPFPSAPRAENRTPAAAASAS